MGQRRVPSAAFVLGMFSGLLAALTVLPTAAPLIHRVSASEQRLALYHVDKVATLADQLASRGQLSLSTFQNLGVDHLTLHEEGGDTTSYGISLESPLRDRACASPTPSVAGPDSKGRYWAVTCYQGDHSQIISGWISERTSPFDLFSYVFLLAVAVGLVTALGVLRLLAPIGRVSRALEQVSMGERGVRLQSTGLAELDELVKRLNDAAATMDGREEEVVGRIQAMDQLTRMVAHEVRNPLQSLELLTSLVASEEDPQERREIARSIHDEIHGLNLIVQRLLKEGSLPGQLRLIQTDEDMETVLRGVIRMRTPEATAHGVALSLVVELPQPVVVSIDRALLSRSIENLVLNGMQFTPRQGAVRMTLSESPDLVRISVEDNGPGVDEALVDHIFDANISGRTGGTGLGLALVRAVVLAHQGEITVGRSPLGGALFTVTIPRTERTR
ncbi:MAG: HAMP domain-containing histidine kinase [Deltaproteobacteria bacterium]|nr:HAMP domain-containing histidine kinase [Deltaproteobacteria bacterium]